MKDLIREGKVKHLGLSEVVTNVTACIDGYLDGWMHFCETDGLNCDYWVSTEKEKRKKISSLRNQKSLSKLNILG